MPQMGCSPGRHPALRLLLPVCGEGLDVLLQPLPVPLQRLQPPRQFRALRPQQLGLPRPRLALCLCLGFLPRPLLHRAGEVLAMARRVGERRLLERLEPPRTHLIPPTHPFTHTYIHTYACYIHLRGFPFSVILGCRAMGCLPTEPGGLILGRAGANPGNLPSKMETPGSPARAAVPCSRPRAWALASSCCRRSAALCCSSRRSSDSTVLGRRVLPKCGHRHSQSYRGDCCQKNWRREIAEG